MSYEAPFSCNVRAERLSCYEKYDDPRAASTKKGTIVSTNVSMIRWSRNRLDLQGILKNVNSWLRFHFDLNIFDLTLHPLFNLVKNGKNTCVEEKKMV
jgi:hypothetical protein